MLLIAFVVLVVICVAGALGACAGCGACARRGARERYGPPPGTRRAPRLEEVGDRGPWHEKVHGANTASALARHIEGLPLGACG